jgi:FKBP-type peptidyl-prolyl cis-trans isomerase FkpA
MNKIISFLFFGSLLFSILSCEDQDQTARDRQALIDKRIIEIYAENNQINGSFDEYGIFISQITAGTGTKSPKVFDGVVVKYDLSVVTGELIESGENFYQHGIGHYFSGWEIGVSRMKVGEKSVFVIPSSKAFGSRTDEFNGKQLPYGAILVLTLELKELIDEKDVIDSYLSKNNITATKTESGLYFHEIAAGIDTFPKTSDTVTVNYKGFFLGGKVFDEGAKPLVFRIGRGCVVPGFEEGIKLLKDKGKATIIVPSNLAYGIKGVSANGKYSIPPYAILVFDIEIAALNDKTTQTALSCNK